LRTASFRHRLDARGRRALPARATNFRRAISFRGRRDGLVLAIFDHPQWDRWGDGRRGPHASSAPKRRACCATSTAPCSTSSICPQLELQGCRRQTGPMPISLGQYLPAQPVERSSGDFGENVAAQSRARALELLRERLIYLPGSGRTAPVDHHKSPDVPSASWFSSGSPMTRAFPDGKASRRARGHDGTQIVTTNLGAPDQTPRLKNAKRQPGLIQINWRGPFTRRNPTC